MLHGGTNIQVVGKGTDRDFGLLIGPRFEMIEFIGTNSWEREEMSNSGFYANGSPVYQLAYHRRTMNLGLTLGGLFSMSSRFSLSMGIVGGFGRVYAKYNEHYSYNTTWNSNAPQSWFAMKGGVPYMRFVIGVYYKISK